MTAMISRRAANVGTISLLLSSTLLGACSDNVVAPSERPLLEPIASVGWNELARSLVVKYLHDPPLASRVYALLTVAQEQAVAAGVGLWRADGRRASDHAAVVGASATMLAYMYPGETAMLEQLARLDLGNPAWSADPAVSVQIGDSVGRAVARELILQARADNADATWTGTVPSGPGHWLSSEAPPEPPLRPLWGKVRPWFMASGDQLRPAPPPKFGSPEFQAALDEVRHYSDTRTDQQLHIAHHWANHEGTYAPAGRWNAIAADLVTAYDLSERDAVRVFAVLNMAMMDAGIAVWDAKYAYWCIRPSQADRAITTPVGLPNFPAYPSGHSGFSGAASDVLGYFFPGDRARLQAMAEEVAMSRLYGGVHFRFDNEVGLQVGRAVAAIAIAFDRARRGQTAYSRTVP
jgi:membrane-associated phospholipid phosphatase